MSNDLLSSSEGSLHSESGEAEEWSNGEIAGLAMAVILSGIVFALCLLLYVHNSRRFRYWLSRHLNVDYNSLDYGQRLVRFFRHLGEGIRVWRAVRSARPQTSTQSSNGGTGGVSSRADRVRLEISLLGGRIARLFGARAQPISENGLLNPNADLERPVLDDVEQDGAKGFLYQDPIPDAAKPLKKNVRFGVDDNGLVDAKGHSSTPTASVGAKEPAKNSPDVSPIASRLRSTFGLGKRPSNPPPATPSGSRSKRTRCCGDCGQVHEVGQQCFNELYRDAKQINGEVDRNLPHTPIFKPTAPLASLNDWEELERSDYFTAHKDSDKRLDESGGSVQLGGLRQTSDDDQVANESTSPNTSAVNTSRVARRIRYDDISDLHLLDNGTSSEHSDEE